MEVSMKSRTFHICVLLIAVVVVVLLLAVVVIVSAVADDSVAIESSRTWPR